MVLNILRNIQSGQQPETLPIPVAKRYVVYAIWRQASSSTSTSVLVELDRFETRDEAVKKSRELNASAVPGGRRSLSMVLRGYVVAHLVEDEFDEPDPPPDPPQQRSLQSLSGQVRRGPQRNQAIRLVRKDYEPPSVDQLAC